MANPEHEQQLKLGVHAWNEWRTHFGDKPDLSGVDLSGAYLSWGNLREADLRGADLTGAHLAKTHLWKAKLTLANLRGANLSRASLKEADLRQANLRRADLREADLRRADLRGASLKWSDLREADLSNAKVEDADVTQARAGYTVFGSLDLSRVRGLGTIIHAGPSMVGIDTLYASRGQIPEQFLRGAGVNEDFITYIPSLTQNPIEFYSCFISYSHEDKSFARRLHDTLQGKGIRCWLDEKSLVPGEDLYDAIDRGIKEWDKLLLCCSFRSLNSWWVNAEITKAFNKEQQLTKHHGNPVRTLIPLDLDGYLFSDELDSGKASLLTSRVVADFRGWEHDNATFEREFERVLKALRADEGKQGPIPNRRGI